MAPPAPRQSGCGSNIFLFGPPLPIGFFGPGPMADLTFLFPPSGVCDRLTFICVGEFEGVIAVEASADGVNFDVLTQFEAGADVNGSAGPALEFSPVVIHATARFLRANVRAVLKTPVAISLGAQQACDCNLGP